MSARMPQSRRSPARNRSRRSRSHSPRRRKSRSRSRSRERKRSRDRHRSRSKSYDRKRSRSPAKKRYRSPSPRKRSRSPKRHSRSPRQRRRSRSSSSSGDRKYPVKRPADSSVKRHAPQRSRSRSPPPQKYKKAKDDYRRSPSPPSRSMPGGRMYSDQQPSTSSKSLFPSAKSSSSSSRGRDIIDYVVIPVAHRGPKMEKLDKRFQTLEQRASGPFEIDENITIGIHRGPSHIQLDDDYDMPVNYSFNTKTFKMLFPKKDYVKTIFDRDEILAFHHDDVLDEEAYVEKRTISIKPSEKPKSRSSRHDDHDMDYKITFGVDREAHGDRRMVKDSSSRSSRHSRSDYPDVPVTVRLDPKPDPRYEKIYHEQQRKDSQSMSFSESSSRKPGDLRYNLMRRQSDGDRGSDRHDRSMTDARSRIEARRNEGRDTRDDKRGRFGASPPRGRSGASPPRGRSGASPPRDRKRPEKELPDFKNRPDKFIEPWEINPTVTPKGKGYYEHDNRLREDMNYWERKQMFIKTGRFPSSRGRGRGAMPLRVRGGTKQGFERHSGGGASFSSEWKHDKFDQDSDGEDNAGKDAKADGNANDKSTDNNKEKADKKTPEKESSGPKEKKVKSSKKSKSKDKKSDRKSKKGEATQVEVKELKREATQGEGKELTREAIIKQEEELKVDVGVELSG